MNTSDQEVNIKIALGAGDARGPARRPTARNKLLAEMTEDVAAASLRNNYQQSLALSLAERRSARELADYALLMRALEARGLLDRPLEALPSDMELQERARSRARPDAAGACRAAELRQDRAAARPAGERGARTSRSSRPGSPAISRRCCASASPPTSTKHSLRREIIALGLTNAIVNRGGPAMAVRLADETQRTHGGGGLRVPRRARGVRAAGSCGSGSMRSTAGSTGRRSCALPGDAGSRERADAVVPAPRQEQ